jgi:tripartite-type tricarboxylate transporter receptor subunit TctC
MKIKLLCISLLIATTSVFAQEWPQKQVRVLVPLSPGSGTDIIARTIFAEVSKQTGKNFLVENKMGASGTIAASMVAKSEPDGYTLLVNTVTHTVVATSYKNLSYDVENDFTNVTGLIAQPFVIATSSRWKSIAEIIKYGRENPGKLNYGTPGVGSSGHLFMEKFAHVAKIKMVDIPFRGTPEAVTEMMANRLDMFPAPVSSVVSLSKDGRINSVAVSTLKRSPSLPDVPTIAEAGAPGADYSFWIGLFAPAKMDPSLVAKINSEIQYAMAQPEVRAKLLELGAEPIKLSPTGFDLFVKREIKHNAEIVTRSKITME